AGATANVLDLAQVMQRDRLRIEALVLISVLVVLIVLLRRVILSVYLLMTVLFSYYTTLGVAFVVFGLLGSHGFTGMDWALGVLLDACVGGTILGPAFRMLLHSGRVAMSCWLRKHEMPHASASVPKILAAEGTQMKHGS